jgi:hypothetical protein
MPRALLLPAAFQVTLTGRFWVTPEDNELAIFILERLDLEQCPAMLLAG